MQTLTIGIAGGSGSGKSTFTNRLVERFPNDIAVIYHDSYYRPKDDVPFEVRKLANYDHPDSLETDLMVQHLLQLKTGQPIDCPVYDYSLHTRAKEIRHVMPHPVIICEGILLHADARLRDLFDIKIFVEADADERILRRILRDVKERGRDLEGIIKQYRDTVKPMHNQFVEPTKALADLVINSGMNEVAFDVVQAKIAAFLGNHG